MRHQHRIVPLEWAVHLRSWWKPVVAGENRLPIALVAAGALPLAARTGLQGGSEPHDDGSAESTAASGEEFCEAMSHVRY